MNLDKLNNEGGNKRKEGKRRGVDSPPVGLYCGWNYLSAA